MRQGSSLRRGLIANALLVGTFALAAGLAVGYFQLRCATGESAARPKGRGATANSLYQLSSTWQTDSQQTQKLSDLGGRVQILGMIFTRCPSVCPLLVNELKSLDRSMPAKLRDRTGFILVSIDPEHDTEQVLRAYRQRMALDTSRFSLLRGTAANVRELAAVLGFNYGQQEGADITHAKLVTILDPNGRIVHQQAGVDDAQKLIQVIDAELRRREE